MILKNSNVFKIIMSCTFAACILDPKIVACSCWY